MTLTDYDSWKARTPDEGSDEEAAQAGLDAIAQEAFEVARAERILEVLFDQFPEVRAARLRNVAQALLGVL